MKLGSPYSERQVQRDYQAILKLGWFDKVETRVSIEDGLRGGVVVIFEVRELPLILEVKFAGLDTVPEAVVMKAMRRARINLARDAVYDATQVRRAPCCKNNSKGSGFTRPAQCNSQDIQRVRYQPERPADVCD
jgi:outer membrane protein assembly factor BamA